MTTPNFQCRRKGNAGAGKHGIQTAIILAVMGIMFLLPPVLQSTNNSLASEPLNVGFHREPFYNSGPGALAYYSLLFSTPTPVSNYNVRLDLGSSFNYSACSPGGANLRFYDVANVSLSYWIETWNAGGNSTVWIKVPHAGTSVINMECGALALLAVSNGDQTFPFFDDFSGSSVNTSKWVVYQDTYGKVSVAGGIVNITTDTPNDEYQRVDIGFSNTYVQSGAASGERYDDAVAFGSNCTVTRENFWDPADPFGPKTAKTYDYSKRWIVGEVAWINGSLVNFFVNNTFLNSHTNASTIPDTVPVRFVAFDLYNGPGTWWNGYISSVNATLGRPGMAVRTKTWAAYHPSVGGVGPAVILADWVFTRKCAAIEPVITVQSLRALARYSLFFSTPTPVSDYNVRLDLGSSFNYSACSPGGANLRFYDVANASLSYWIETWNAGGNSTVWIKVPHAGTSVINMECGALVLLAVSNGDQTFPFFDDFSGSSVNTSKWVVYQDTYGKVSVAGGIVNITTDTPNDVYQRVDIGFGNTYVVSGAGSGERYDDAVAFGSNCTVTREDYQATGRVTTKIYNYNKRWISAEVAWINMSLANFYANNTFVNNHTTADTIPNAFVPVRFVAFDTYWGPGSWWNGYISSVNATLGRPGMAVRTKVWTAYNPSLGGIGPAVILADWVFTRKCAAIEPVISLEAPDTQAPVITVQSPLPGELINTSLVNLAITVQEKHLDEIWYTLDGGTRVLMPTNTSITVSEGPHEIIFYANDTVGNMASASWSFQVDSLAPVITVQSPIASQISSSSQVSLEMEATDTNLDVVWYVLDSGPVTMMPTNTNITVTDGPHSITFYANDTFGHTSSITRSFTVDTTAPFVDITSPTSGATLTSTIVNVTFTATDLNKDDTWYTVNGGAATIVTGSSFLLSLADGSYTIVVSCNDSLGRISSDTISFTIDATMPTITASGFGGTAMFQGDVEYLNWTLSDAHPATYALRLNGQVIRSGVYGSSTLVSVLIDSSSLGTLNYTMSVQDTFGNVERHVRLITVSARTDGGIFLHVGLNTFHEAGSINLDLNLTMSHWAVLYLYVELPFTTPGQLHLGDLPSGLVIAVPVAFNLNITNGSALSSGFLRLHYSQALIASQVNEKSLVVLRWGTSTWDNTDIVVDVKENYVDIPLSVNGLYILASTPKQDYLPILIILLIGITGGIVAAAGYHYRHKKGLKAKSAGKSKGKPGNYTGTPVSSATAMEDALEAHSKRARLMQQSTVPVDSKQAAEHVTVPMDVQVAKKKASAASEPRVDIAARAENALEMASEVNVDVQTPRCIVHKGTIAGFSFTCPKCGVHYCIPCVKHVASVDGKCWSCQNPVEARVGEAAESPGNEESALPIPKGSVAIFKAEVWEKMKVLQNEGWITAEMLPELIGELTSIAPATRLQYLDQLNPWPQALFDEKGDGDDQLEE